MSRYYYINSQKQQAGPVEIPELMAAGLRPDTMVWCEGMANWTRADNVPELAKELVAAPAAPTIPGVQPPATDNNDNTGYTTEDSSEMKPAKPANMLWLCILTTACCCMPLGIVSIIYATKVDSAYNVGNYQEAEDNAKKARLFAIIGAVAGFIGIILYTIIMVLAEL